MRKSLRPAKDDLKELRRKRNEAIRRSQNDLAQTYGESVIQQAGKAAGAAIDRVLAVMTNGRKQS